MWPVLHARAVSGADESLRERVAAAHENDLDVGMPRLELKRGGNRYTGAVVAPHAVDRNRDQDYSSLVWMTFLPR